jgi:hypothetical protein
LGFIPHPIKAIVFDRFNDIFEEWVVSGKILHHSVMGMATAWGLPWASVRSSIAMGVMVDFLGDGLETAGVVLLWHRG